MSTVCITNLYHLVQNFNIKTCLIDGFSEEYTSNVLGDYNLDVSKITIKNKKSITPSTYHDLKDQYDLIIVWNNQSLLRYFFHKAKYIYIVDQSNDPDDNYDINRYYTRLQLLVSEYNSALYYNDYLSKIFENTLLSVHQQTFVRDKPYKFLLKEMDILSVLDKKIVIEIGASRTFLGHDIKKINPKCCNDSHSTFFWTRMDNALVHTCDINQQCKSVLEKGNKDGYLEFGDNTKLKVHIQDGIQFLEKYKNNTNNPGIDLLFLDAWDVGTYNYAEKHKQAYTVIKDKLNEKCMVVIDDTDISQGGKGKLVIPTLLNDNFIILYKGRHTVLIRV
jgi:hypothetical protein